jgi:hypothetical protein
MTFKAVEVDAASRQRTGREYQLDCATRQAALEELLHLLGLSQDVVRVDPTRTLVEVGERRWTLVAAPRQRDSASGTQRRGGAKHKQVR